MNLLLQLKASTLRIRPGQSQKIRKGKTELNATINRLHVNDVYRELHPTTAEDTFFSSSCETFTKTDHILSHKIHFNKLQRIEIIQCMLADHSGIKH